MFRLDAIRQFCYYTYKANLISTREECTLYISQLSTFLKVVELGSFNKAARHLYISSSAVIQQINALERDFGVRLFQRSRSGLRLTAAGEHLVGEAREFIRQNDQLRSRLLELDSQKPSIVVGTTIEEKCRLLYDLWILFTQGNTRYDIRMEVSQDRKMMPRQVQLVESIEQNLALACNSMRALLNLDSGLVDLLYAMYDTQTGGETAAALSPLEAISFILDNSAFHSLLDADRLSQLSFLQSVMQGAVDGTAYSSSELAALFGMDSDSVQQLFALYQSQHTENGGVQISVQQMLTFLRTEVLPNPAYSGMIDAAAAAKLQMAGTLTDAVVSGQLYTPEQAAQLLGSLAGGMDGNTMRLLYLYYASKVNSDPAWTLTIDELFEMGNEAVFIGSGAGLPRFMGIPGESLRGVYSANEFLTRINLMKAYLPDSKTPIRRGNKVAVVGGGNVAMDAARCAKRLGAEEVTIVYRRSMNELPARKEEVEHAMEEGIVFKTLTNPVEVLGYENPDNPRDPRNGEVVGMKCVEMELGEPDASGRRRPVEIKGSEHDIPCDAVIVALGNNSNPLISRTTPDIHTDPKGHITVDDSQATSMTRVWAGGDIVLGAATVILAMGEGRKAAASINEYLAK